jgi:hypothetical protein
MRRCELGKEVRRFINGFLLVRMDEYNSAIAAGICGGASLERG